MGFVHYVNMHGIISPKSAYFDNPSITGQVPHGCIQPAQFAFGKHEGSIVTPMLGTGEKRS